MNIIALDLATRTFGVTDFPFREAFVLALLCAGIALLVVAGYLLFAGCARSAIPIDPAPVDD